MANEMKKITFIGKITFPKELVGERLGHRPGKAIQMARDMGRKMHIIDASRDWTPSEVGNKVLRAFTEEVKASSNNIEDVHAFLSPVSTIELMTICYKDGPVTYIIAGRLQPTMEIDEEEIVPLVRYAIEEDNFPLVADKKV